MVTKPPKSGPRAKSSATAKVNAVVPAASERAPMATGTAALAEGDAVTWQGADGDIPAGTIGFVVRLHLEGDVEVEFPAIAAGGRTIYSFAPDRLDRASPAAIEAHTAVEARAAAEKARERGSEVARAEAELLAQFNAARATRLAGGEGVSSEETARVEAALLVKFEEEKAARAAREAAARKAAVQAFSEVQIKSSVTKTNINNNTMSPF
jgi:hypothetical protein